MKLATFALAAAFLCTQSLAYAVPVTDWRADDLLMQAPEIKKELALSENQNLLWEQSLRKTRAILRLRKERRDELDAASRKLAAEPSAEMRTLAAALADDAASVHDEDKELREIWFTMNDALDDRQRALVLARFRSMLERQPPGPGEGRPERAGKPEGGERGGRGGRGPGGGGPSGGGSIGMGMGRGF
ncbi:hypothetical protein LK542_12990 [Massilia sp. IC2-477]|uniref:hypothetical protein n=1 Tax=Massilia sp. IC2-477 TaxID=2887198 RepID=UPI001D0F9D75|nr:hypothetical protein [Massilia sp. IC2-477]MCC2956530.1 hypothetical protein [Massilia sp. IC2-477]